MDESDEMAMILQWGESTSRGETAAPTLPETGDQGAASSLPHPE